MTNERIAARILVDQLRLNGVSDVFCVPGESFLAVLDSLRDTPIRVTGRLRASHMARNRLSSVRGTATRTLGHATSGPALQQNLVCVMASSAGGAN